MQNIEKILLPDIPTLLPEDRRTTALSRGKTAINIYI